MLSSFHFIQLGTRFLCELLFQVYSRNSDFWESRKDHEFVNLDAMQNAGGIQLGKL